MTYFVGMAIFLGTPIPVPKRIAILSEAPHRFIADTALEGAQSKDPNDVNLAHDLRSFPTTDAKQQDLATTLEWSRV